MAFSLSCTNKGCGNIQEPYIDPKTDKVYCSLCDKELPNVTYFIKVQMKNSKQFKPKKKDAFSVKCNKCSNNAQPILLNNELLCSNCKKILDNLSLPFKNILKEKLKNKE